MLLATAGCSRTWHEDSARQVLRLAVTTSTRDSGLLDVLIPVFEQDRPRIRVDVIAVGTGAALRLGEAGDVDVVLVHARVAEDEFMARRCGIRREDVMYNMFEILGPPEDPAGIRGSAPADALQAIAKQRQRFVSRGDESGTHKREQQLWNEGGGRPDWADYIQNGQGMGATLTMADQLNAYVLSDRGTYLNFRQKIRLQPIEVRSESMKNPYGIIVVNPENGPGINVALAQEFVDFVISPEAQQLIDSHRINGEQLFYPSRISTRTELP